MNESWNLDRRPTTAERVIGVIGSLLLCAAGSTALWFSLSFLRNIWAVLFTGGFTVLSAFLLYRIIFTSGQKLGRRDVTALAWVFIVVGFDMLICGALVQDLQGRLVFAGLGLSGISAGILNFSKGKK